jgi:hypothetical protein
LLLLAAHAHHPSEASCSTPGLLLLLLLLTVLVPEDGVQQLVREVEHDGRCFVFLNSASF